MPQNKNKTITPVTAAGGAVVRKAEDQSEPQVLLIFRRGVWDLPKGKLEESETVEECAVREVAEEVGLSGKPQIISALPETYHEYELEEEYFGKTTYWYLMMLDSDTETFKPEHEEGIEKVQWHPLSDAKQKVGYDNLLEVLEAVDW
ncbi:NUDIX domain-containing protein [Aliifodinibius sp. 1BSP15-2V2]|uniref:NUDIX domain-containing protein n=2 Tax=Fodinibius salsisoli TaxID=2820877 RepID=A0ABT3PPT1_9BACT|nr:NUDIX domain-containing protein [Fodinibius salsisoli]